MSAEPVQAEDHTEHLRQMVRLAHELSANIQGPAAWAQWTTALAALQPMLHEQRAFAEVLATPEFQATIRRAFEVITAADPSALKATGPARKVSVSMPEDLTTAVQQRVGRGKFSQYVTEAVTRQLELDLLAELSELITVEHGPVPEEYMAEARAAWPDGE